MGFKARTIDRYADATILRPEQHRHRGSRDIEALQLASLDSAYIHLCSDRIANDASSVKMRLMRPAKSPRKGERSLSRKQEKWLREGVGRFSSKLQDITEASGDFVEVVDHPVLDQMRRPNVYQTEKAFRYMRHKLEGVIGDSFEIVGDAQGNVLKTIGAGPRIRNRHLLLSQWTTPVAGESELVSHYYYGRDQSAVTEFAEDEVWASQWAPNIHNPMRGKAPHSAFASEQEVYLSLIQYLQAMLDNEMRPSFLINVEGNLSPDARKAIIARLEAEYRGVANVGKAIVIDGHKATIEVANHAPKDLGHETIIRNRIVDILAAYGIPESQVYMNDANLASSVTGKRQYAEETIGPRVGSEAEYLTESLLVEAWGLEGWCFVPDQSFIPEDQEANWTRVGSASASAIITINEARGELGFDPIEGGDTLRMNGVSIDALDKQATQPIGGGFGFGGGQGGFTLSSPEPETKALPEGDSPDAGEVETDAPQTPEAAASNEDGSSSDTDDAPADGEKCGCDHDTKEILLSDLWAKSEPRAKSVEGAEDRSPYREDLPETAELYKAAKKAQRHLLKTILARVEAEPFGLKHRGTAKRITDPVVVQRLLTAWLGVPKQDSISEFLFVNGGAQKFRSMASVGLDEGVRQLEAVGAAFDDGEIPVIERPEVLEQFTEHEQRFRDRLTTVDDTVADRLRAQIVEGLGEDETTTELSRRIRGIIDDDASAERLARTETAFAQIEGRKSAFKANPNVVGKRFLKAPNACPFCDATEAKFGGGKVVPMDEAFMPKGSTLVAANGQKLTNNLNMDMDVPVHPHCRCDIEVVIRGAE